MSRSLRLGAIWSGFASGGALVVEVVLLIWLLVQAARAANRQLELRENLQNFPQDFQDGPPEGNEAREAPLLWPNNLAPSNEEQGRQEAEESQEAQASLRPTAAAAEWGHNFGPKASSPSSSGSNFLAASSSLASVWEPQAAAASWSRQADHWRRRGDKIDGNSGLDGAKQRHNDRPAGWPTIRETAASHKPGAQMERPNRKGPFNRNKPNDWAAKSWHNDRFWGPKTIESKPEEHRRVAEGVGLAGRQLEPVEAVGEANEDYDEQGDTSGGSSGEGAQQWEAGDNVAALVVGPRGQTSEQRDKQAPEWHQRKGWRHTKRRQSPLSATGNKNKRTNPLIEAKVNDDGQTTAGGLAGERDALGAQFGRQTDEREKVGSVAANVEQRRSGASWLVANSVGEPQGRPAEESYWPVGEKKLTPPADVHSIEIGHSAGPDPEPSGGRPIHEPLPLAAQHEPAGHYSASGPMERHTPALEGADHRLVSPADWLEWAPAKPQSGPHLAGGRRRRRRSRDARVAPSERGAHFGEGPTFETCERQFARCQNDTLLEWPPEIGGSEGAPSEPLSEASSGGDATERGPVCGSNGRLFESLCHMHKFACTNQITLTRRESVLSCGPVAATRRQQDGPNDIELDERASKQEPSKSIALGEDWPWTRLASGLEQVEMEAAAAEEASAGQMGAQGELHECKGEVFEEFQLMLLTQFGGNARWLFDFLDLNKDAQLEARELWPRQEAGPIGAQPPIGTEKVEGKHQRSTEFAFEPYFGQNPCSLSHLILLAPQETEALDWDNFQLMFEKIVAKFSSQRSSQKEQKERRREPHSVYMKLGETTTLNCGSTESASDDSEPPSGARPQSCRWTRQGFELAPNLDEPHLVVSGNRLVLKQAQLYLSGRYECECLLSPVEQEARPQNSLPSNGSNHRSEFMVQVYAQPQVSVKPAFQWSLPNSRVLFECRHDFIDTSLSLASPKPDDQLPRGAPDELGGGREAGNVSARLNGYLTPTRVSWLKGSVRLPLVEGATRNGSRTPVYEAGQLGDIGSLSSSPRTSISMASSRLELERLQLNDSGDYFCQVEVPLGGGEERGDKKEAPVARNEPASGALLVQDPSGMSGELLLLQQPGLQMGLPNGGSKKQSDHYLWIFHEKGIGVYRLQDDDGQEMELVGQLPGNSAIKAQVDGNWNQLTLCGGLNQEQVVICEWSDNALYLEQPTFAGQADQFDSKMTPKSVANRRPAKYIYVGQPNLNRIIIIGMGAEEESGPESSAGTGSAPSSSGPNVNNAALGVENFSQTSGGTISPQVVAIIQTDPQPRRLFSFKPNKLHLSKWLRQRLSPAALSQWLATSHPSAQQQQQAHDLMNSSETKILDHHNMNKHHHHHHNKHHHSSNQQNGGSDHHHHHHHHHRRQFSAHPLELTPKSSRLYSVRPQLERRQLDHLDGLPEGTGPTLGRHRDQYHLHSSYGGQLNKSDWRPSSSLVQHDIWVLCYGQPLVVNLDEEREANEGPLAQSGPATDERATREERGGKDSNVGQMEAHDQSERFEKPFTPILSRTPFVWHQGPELDHANSIATDRFSKSVQIIQSTFLPYNYAQSRDTHHQLNSVTEDEEHRAGQQNGPLAEQERPFERDTRAGAGMMKDGSFVNHFKRSTVITTHHIGAENDLIAGPKSMPYITDLYVPPEPHSLKDNLAFQQHYAYAIDHNEKNRISRISLDSYRYDKIINLNQVNRTGNSNDQNVDNSCEPINLVVAAQGLLIIQCRRVGQLVLDQLTHSKIEFNPNIRAQKSYLSPDHRYLVSVNTYSAKHESTTSSPNRRSVNSRASTASTKQSASSSSVIYVQLVSVRGLELQYEIKTTLEISQCSFVWRDGYYAAIFVSSNKRDQQSEVLSLRLADSRLELIARVPGLISTGQQKEALEILPELQLAALSTRQGTYIVDLEDNRVTQTLIGQVQRHHQCSTPTLLWVAT